MTIEKPHHWKTHPILGEDARKLKLWNSLPRFQGFVPSEHPISAAQVVGTLPVPIVDCFYKAVEGSSIFLFSQTNDLLFASWVSRSASHSFLKGLFQFSTNWTPQVESDLTRIRQMFSEWQYRKADIPGLDICIKCVTRRKWTAYGLWWQFHKNTERKWMFSDQWQHFGWKQKRTHPTEYWKNFPSNHSCTHFKIQSWCCQL